MPVKTITIDLEAYDRLKRAMKPDESFSQAIKRVVPKPFDLKAWLRKVEKAALNEDALDAIDEVIASRNVPINLERGRAAS